MPRLKPPRVALRSSGLEEADLLEAVGLKDGAIPTRRRRN
jgi:hypothetical protein